MNKDQAVGGWDAECVSEGKCLGYDTDDGCTCAETTRAMVRGILAEEMREEDYRE